MSNYTRRVDIRVTDSEYDELVKQAKYRDMSVSEYIRSLIKKNTMPHTGSVDDWMIERDLDGFEYDGCDPLDDDLS